VVAPRLRWMKDAKNDVRELKVKRLTQKSSSGQEWASVLQVHRAAETRSERVMSE
jgi:hypothetical protein